MSVLLKFLFQTGCFVTSQLLEAVFGAWATFHDTDFFLRQPIQIIHQPVNRRVYLVNPPLERKAPVFFSRSARA